MSRLYYDLHIHSCLSPCGDNDMTPANIVGMAMLKELDVIAVTDHNTCRNCASVMKAAAGSGLLVIAGMELCTEEEIHTVCLFEHLEDALRFDEYVRTHSPLFDNDPAIYGRQILMDEADGELGEIEHLLVSASGIGIYDLPHLMEEFHGIWFPAHIDKAAYSVTASLGTVPDDLGFYVAEIAKPQKIDAMCEQYPLLKSVNIVTDSDAHYLWDISERYYALETEEKTVSAFLKALQTI